ncbi:MAG: hypothetical protein MO852_05505 [Candidatus Devosia euplotis]|nr:hypothetical protein [Candidatus Devosia euplotis]
MTDVKPNPIPLTVNGADPLSGRFTVPGDGAISLRALLLTSAQALRQMGVTIERHGDDWQVSGLGVARLMEPEGSLKSEDCATSTMLLLGLLAPYGFATSISASPG